MIITNITVCCFVYRDDHRAVGICKKMVSSLSYSWKKWRDLGFAQDKLGLPKHMLTAETPTRWGSRQKMIERVLEHDSAISQVLKADRKCRHLVLSWQDVDVLEPTPGVPSCLVRSALCQCLLPQARAPSLQHKHSCCGGE